MEILKKFSNGFIAVKCGFCNGTGQFPETAYSDDNFKTDPCDVCNGKGFNIFFANEEFIIPCKCCNEEGKGYDESGYYLGDHCPVCDGKGCQNISEQVLQSFDEQFWILLNLKIVEVAKNRFDNGHYADAVEAAFKEINSVTKELVLKKINVELDGSALMERALSLKDPLIVLDDLSSKSGENIQKGFIQIFSGAMTGIRNPKTHSNIIINKELAIYYLFLASLIMNKIEQS